MMPIQEYPPFAAPASAGAQSSFRLAIVLLLLCAIIDPPPVAGWGATGHEVVANVAWRLLSNDTRASIERILGPTIQEATSSSSSSCPDCSPLALVADWADQARYTTAYHWTAPLHYIDVRDNLIEGGCPAGAIDDATRSPLCAFNYTRDCTDDFCVAGAIANYTRQLHPSKIHGPADDGGAKVALKFVVHFVGDIHQPLHCSRTSDRGGNSIDVHWEFSGDEAAAAAELAVVAPLGCTSASSADKVCRGSTASVAASVTAAGTAGGG